jgi:hypothetical protein
MVAIKTIDNHDFLVRNITIFENTQQEMEVTIGSTALQHYLSRNSQNFTQSNEYSRIDESIAYYASPMQLIKMSDEELQKMVEESY